MSDPDYGTPYGPGSADPVDDWSRAVFDACRGWPLAASGRWFRWEEGWLSLRIEEVDGERLEPLFAIELDTADWRLSVSFGSWSTPISPSSASVAEASERAVAQARELVEGWLRGDVKLASYSDETGWRGSKILYGGALPAAVEPVPVRIGEQARVIVKRPRRSDWRSWRWMGDGVWIECEVAEE